jgi:hypothetical protein
MGKSAGHEADNISPFIVEIKNSGTIPPIQVFMV